MANPKLKLEGRWAGRDVEFDALPEGLAITLVAGIHIGDQALITWDDVDNLRDWLIENTTPMVDDHGGVTG